MLSSPLATRPACTAWKRGRRDRTAVEECITALRRATDCLPQPGRLEAIDGEEGRGVESARCGRPAGVAMVSSVPLNSPLHVGLCKPRVLARDLGTTLSMKQGTSYTPAVTDMVTRVLELHLRREGVSRSSSDAT